MENSNQEAAGGLLRSIQFSRLAPDVLLDGGMMGLSDSPRDHCSTAPHADNTTYTQSRGVKYKYIKLEAKYVACDTLFWWWCRVDDALR